MTADSTTPVFGEFLRKHLDAEMRRKLIYQLEKKLAGKVISYIENPSHPNANIQSQDVTPFEDVLRATGKCKKGFLILNSRGGEGNTAEKLLTMCRERFSDEFTVIVPNFAKSAATMICLGADKIMMGYLAELGPIDPQILVNNQPIPARSFLDGLDLVRHNVKVDGDSPALYMSMLQQVRPEILAMCNSAIASAQEFATTWLSKYMFKEDVKQAKKVANLLSDGKTYKSHGKMIGYREAQDKLKLKVELISPESDIWNLIWELYVVSTAILENNPVPAMKLIESSKLSLMDTLSPHS